MKETLDRQTSRKEKEEED